ncbi:histone H1.10-like [Pristis pectinata]|uniref:histone H1.10-like n=1 Tax=Pristis pectinata TaxID=685728 RepID=UPI00223E202D|nr:histone H1.10-like [Pristis pectinata]
MAEIAPSKADGPAAPPDLSGAPPATLSTNTAATKKKAAYRSQKAAAAEHILEAVAATKERQAPKLGAVKKTTSATGYEADKAGARPNPPADALPKKGSAVEGAAGGGSSSASALRPNREVKGEQGETEDRSKGGTKRKAAASKKGAAAKPAAQKRATKPAAKRPRKRTAAKAKVPKRRAASRTAGRRGRGVKRR